MNTRLLAALNISLSVTAASLLASPASSFAFPGDKPAEQATPSTEDVLMMKDGRELHGQIVSKSRTQVVFEYKDPKLNIKTKLTLSMDDIAEIKEDVALTTAAPDAGADKSAKPGTTTIAPSSGSTAAGKKDKGEAERTFGASRMQTDDPTVPSIYVVPMKGQMGTDINSEIYKKIVDDVKAKKPDWVVIELNSQDVDDALYSTKTEEEAGMVDLDDYRALVNVFQDDLREFKQVCWVDDSVGISSVVAMTWQRMYMKPNARLGGMVVARNETGFESWQDEDVRGKMTAAFMSWIEGFLVTGHYDVKLAQAMVRPQFLLSANWKGREVNWNLDDKGEYLVDSTDERTTEFRAKDAEDFCISKGTAESLDDLALLLGFREYRLADGQAEKICKDYVEDWRRAYENCKSLMQDYQQYRGWSSGADAVKYLGKAKSAIEKVLASMEQYKAVEVRMQKEYGISKTRCKVIIEQIKETLKNIKSAEKGGGAGGNGGAAGGGRGGRGGPGGSPGGR